MKKVVQAVSGTDASERRAAFFKKIDHSSRFFRLFDHLEGLSFFAKDTSGALMSVDRSLLELYGLTDELEIVGKTDFDFLPQSLAKKYRRDDVRVMETGQPIVNMLEVFLNPQGIPGWFRTNKLPVYSDDGRVMGVMGTIQSMAMLELFQGVSGDLRPALACIDQEYDRKLDVSELAALCGVSVRQLERLFRHYFNVPPQQFIAKRRVYEACVALRDTNQEIALIAHKLGFYDHSSFTRQFKKHMGLTPFQYRRRYR